MVKHIKLFENWAEELKVQPELDPNHDFKEGYNLVDHVRRNIFNPTLMFDSSNRRTELELVNYNFKSFSDYDFWLDRYNTIVVKNYIKNTLKLENFEGLPLTNDLEIQYTNIKTFKGLEDRSFSTFNCFDSYIENMKYLPRSDKYSFSENPILSYYTPVKYTSAQHLCGALNNRVDNLAGKLLDFVVDDKYVNHNSGLLYSGTHINDAKINSVIFSYFKYKFYKSYTNNVSINPWHNIYHDPNNVENYEFLFIPFWNADESFREDAHEHLGVTDLSGVTRGKEELW